jgi:hypothetical protein
MRKIKWNLIFVVSWALFASGKAFALACTPSFNVGVTQNGNTGDGTNQNFNFTADGVTSGTVVTETLACTAGPGCAIEYYSYDGSVGPVNTIDPTIPSITTQFDGSSGYIQVNAVEVPDYSSACKKQSFNYALNINGSARPSVVTSTMLTNVSFSYSAISVTATGTPAKPPPDNHPISDYIWRMATWPGGAKMDPSVEVNGASPFLTLDQFRTSTSPSALPPGSYVFEVFASDGTSYSFPQIVRVILAYQVTAKLPPSICPFPLGKPVIVPILAEFDDLHFGVDISSFHLKVTVPPGSKVVDQTLTATDGATQASITPDFVGGYGIEVTAIDSSGLEEKTEYGFNATNDPCITINPTTVLANQPAMFNLPGSGQYTGNIKFYWSIFDEQGNLFCREDDDNCIYSIPIPPPTVPPSYTPPQATWTPTATCAGNSYLAEVRAVAQDGYLYSPVFVPFSVVSASDIFSERSSENKNKFSLFLLGLHRPAWNSHRSAK